MCDFFREMSERNNEEELISKDEIDFFTHMNEKNESENEDE